MFGMQNNDAINYEGYQGLTESVLIINHSPFQSCQTQEIFPKISMKRYDRYKKILKLKSECHQGTTYNVEMTRVMWR